jgi:uncharacterized protein (UPF0332 family)
MSEHRDEAAAARQKARRALQTARRNLEDGDADGAVNRTYYAAFYLASAALHLAGEQPNTHKGVHMRFRRRFVKDGSFPEDLAGLLTYAQQQREKADYNFMTIYDTSAASDLLEDVEAFCEEAETLLDDLAREGE